MKKISAFIGIMMIYFGTKAQTNIFPSSGNVGVGTLSPFSSLHVVGKTTTDSIALTTNLYYPPFSYVNGAIAPSTTSGMMYFGSENAFMLRSDKTFSTGAGNNNANGYTDIFIGRGFPGSIQQMTNGGGNIAIGDAFFNDPTSYPNNPSFGKLTSGFLNTLVGQGSYSQLTSGYFNTAVGYSNLFSVTSGISNTSIGYGNLKYNTTGNYNLGAGIYGLRNNTVGGQNVALGYSCLITSDSGSYNTAVGVAALYYMHGNNQYNTAVGGYSALQNMITGNNNTAIGGRRAGYNLTTGNNNTFVGSYAGEGSTASALNNATAIGYQASVQSDNTIILGNNSIVGVAFGNGLSTANAMLEVQNNTSNNTIINLENSRGAKLLSLDSSGNCFINGNTKTRKLIVTQTGWSDYVFDDNYSLMPLSKVDEFIRVNRHLPDIPTTKEINESGVDVGNVQSLLLKKVEELTLYVIEQNKRIEQLSKDNNILKAEIKKRKTEN